MSDLSARLRANLTREYKHVDDLLNEAADELERLHDERHKNDRVNYETTADGFRICRGYHERSAGCEWEYFVPRAAHNTS